MPVCWYVPWITIVGDDATDWNFAGCSIRDVGAESEIRMLCTLCLLRFQCLLCALCLLRPLRFLSTYRFVRNPRMIGLTRTLAVAEAEIPAVTFSASKYPELAANIRNAQLGGHPEILTYGGESSVNRKAALEGLYKIPKILSRDEYPFASTLEGGASSWIGHIPEWQNRAQGGILSRFYQTHGLTAGSRFRVLLGD